MIIALLTDFGVADYFVAAMKGAILSINRRAVIVDITHEIPPQNIKSAGFTLRACRKDFPLKTIFVCVVDPGVGSDRRAILVETDECFFVAPDNGLLSFVFNEAKFFRVFELTSKKFFNPHISQTFHGRDVYAPVAAYLSKGVEAVEFGDEITDFIRLNIEQPRKISQNTIEAKIIHADNFGNLITNLTKNDLPARFFLEFNGIVIDNFLDYFAQAEEGEIGVILGSAGFLEIVAYKSSAKNMLNAKLGDRVLLNKVK